MEEAKRLSDYKCRAAHDLIKQLRAKIEADKPSQTETKPILAKLVQSEQQNQKEKKRKKLPQNQKRFCIFDFFLLLLDLFFLILIMIMILILILFLGFILFFAVGVQNDMGVLEAPADVTWGNLAPLVLQGGITSGISCVLCSGTWMKVRRPGFGFFFCSQCFRENP